MDRARAHRRLAGFGSFALLALAAELAGRSLTVRLDLGRHVPTPSYGGADYYPFLLAGVKVAIALMLAALTWRFFKARAAARAARRLLARVGAPIARGAADASPALRPQLGDRVRADRRLLPRPDRQRALRRRPVAADVAVAAHVGALRLRGPRGARRAAVRRGVALALRLRALREGRRRRRAFASAPRRLGRSRPVTRGATAIRLAASSVSRSSRGLLPSRRSTGQTPGLSSTREEE